MNSMHVQYHKQGAAYIVPSQAWDTTLLSSSLFGEHGQGLAWKEGIEVSEDAARKMITTGMEMAVIASSTRLTMLLAKQGPGLRLDQECLTYTTLYLCYVPFANRVHTIRIHYKRTHHHSITSSNPEICPSLCTCSCIRHRAALSRLDQSASGLIMSSNIVHGWQIVKILAFQSLVRNKSRAPLKIDMHCRVLKLKTCSSTSCVDEERERKEKLRLLGFHIEARGVPL